MKYFIDTEFLERKQDKKFLGFKYGETKATIDLISIGMVGEDGREYYAISKEFNLEEAWNRYQLEIQSGDMRNKFPEGKKVYWLRENVLKPIFYELLGKDIKFHNIDNVFTFNNFKWFINKYGKTNEQIAEEIKEFVTYKDSFLWSVERPEYKSYQDRIDYLNLKFGDIKFYADYADYDWVVFCWLFGGMNDLPKGFPYYCIDLRQILDSTEYKECKIVQQTHGWSGLMKVISETQLDYNVEVIKPSLIDESPKIGCKFTIFKRDVKEVANGDIKSHPDYPKQKNEHNALDDARWNKELYYFLNKL